MIVFPYLFSVSHMYFKLNIQSPKIWFHLQNDIGLRCGQGSCAPNVGCIGNPQVEHHLHISEKLLSSPVLCKSVKNLFLILPGLLKILFSTECLAVALHPVVLGLLLPVDLLEHHLVNVEGSLVYK